MSEWRLPTDRVGGLPDQRLEDDVEVVRREVGCIEVDLDDRGGPGSELDDRRDGREVGVAAEASVEWLAVRGCAGVRYGRVPRDPEPARADRQVDEVADDKAGEASCRRLVGQIESELERVRSAHDFDGV